VLYEVVMEVPKAKQPSILNLGEIDV
jgi:hypothetical protein